MTLFKVPGAKSRQVRRAAEEAARGRLRSRVEARIQDMKARSRFAASPTVNDELRNWTRKQSYNVASATYEGGAEVSCLVVDVSFGGMRVEFFDDKARPEEFALTVPTLRFIGIVQSAWSAGGQTGVEVLRWRESA